MTVRVLKKNNNKNKEIMPSKYGFGNTRKKSPYNMGKAHYGKDQKNPIMMKSPMRDDFMTKAKAGLGTAADIFKSNEPLTKIKNIKKTFKTNLEYQKYLKKKKAENRDKATE